jgi:hypothetical protein
MLNDIQTLARFAGLAGLILLFDEVEDIIHNLSNVQHQEKAFANLFHFFAGKRFHGLSFYAVTPDFVEKCKRCLLEKDRWDYDYSRFDSLPSFEMSPLEAPELGELAQRMETAHAQAYDWTPDVRPSELRRVVRVAAGAQVQDRARQTIRKVVEFLDDRLGR